MRDGRIKSCRLAGLSCLFLWISFPVHPQIHQGITVYGRVFLPDSRPAVQVTVNISGQNGFNASAKTDERGGFRFEGIPRTVYSLTVSAPQNAQYYAEPVSVNASRDGNSFMADIFLRNPLEAPLKKERSAQVTSVKEASQRIPRDARKALDRAQKYREQKKYEAALAELDKALKLYPDYFQAITERGIVRINTGHLQEALLDFGKAIEIFPEYAPALSGAGYCLLTMGKYEQSIALLEKAIQLDPTRTQTLLFLGIANVAVGQWQRAQRALEQALKLDAAGAVAAHIYLADAYAGQHLYSRAADELRTYLQLNPDAPNADRLRQREKYWRDQKATEH
jgi:tetratricopeptide (TPR) repeat protein